MADPQVATNPKTGEVLVLQDGQWSKPERTAISPDGRRAFLFDGKWIMGGAAGNGDQVKPVSQSQPFVPSGEKSGPDGLELLNAQPLFKLSQGAADPFLGLAQRADRHLGLMGGHFNELMEQREKALTDGEEPDSFDAARTAGNVLSPGWLKAASMVKTGKTLAQRMMQGGAFGAAGAAADPQKEGQTLYDDAQKVAVGTGGGVLAAPGIELAGKVAKTAYRGLIEPLFNSAAIKGRAYLDAAGDKVDDIIKLLTERKEIVPGSRPTAGEAASPAGRAEFSALQESARRNQPSGYVARTDEQNAARVDSIREWAGNPAKRAEDVAKRSARATPYYEEGMQQQAHTSGLEPLLERPSTKAVLTRAERLLQEKDKEFAPLFPNGLPRNMTGEEAQAMKLSFDDLIKLQPKGGMDTAELDAIKETRKAFVGWMEKAFPDLGTGRKLYRMGSGKVNQDDVGEALLERLTPALREDGKLRGTVFSNAARDSAGVIKKATGEPRFDRLEEILTGRQLKSVHNVQDDLARSDRHADLARQGSGAVNAVDLATQNLVNEGGKPPSFLHRGAMIANYIISRMEGKVDRKLAAEMAAEMLDPPKVAEGLAQAQARAAKNKALAEAIHNWQRPVIAGAAASGDQ